MNETKPTSSSSEEKVPAPAAAGQSKIAAVLALLKTVEGTTLDDLVAATGWQKHTARAVLSGLKKKGHIIDRKKVGGVSRYRATGAAD